MVRLAFTLLFLVLSMTTYRPSNHAVLKEENTPALPNDMELVRMSWPATVFDDAAYATAMAEAGHAPRSGERDETWQLEGPTNIGGRINCLVRHPQNQQIFYAGTPDGGVWKTTNGGGDWFPVFDDVPWLAIGAIAIDPVDPETVYVGTGDVNISGNVQLGMGIYKSTDGGASWNASGLSEGRVISKIVIDPVNPDILYAGAMGNPFQQDTNRGLYKSIDGGQNWEQSLFVDTDAGIIDLLMDPTNPQILYAASFNRLRTELQSVIAGPDAHIWKTTDGGDTWNNIDGNLPDGDYSRIGLAISPTNPLVVCATLTDSDSNLMGILKTINGGLNWQQVPTTSLLDQGNPFGGFGWYFGKIFIGPESDNHIYILGVDQWHTVDGGQNWEMLTPPWWYYETHADGHDLFFEDADHFILSTDGGMFRTTDGGANWSVFGELPISQFYHITEDPANPGFIFGGMQDNGTSAGNANDLSGWPRIYGGDGFKTLLHPFNSDIQYYSTQYGGFVYTDDGGWNISGLSMPTTDEGERYNWDSPWMLGALDPDVLFFGGTKVYKINNAPGGFYTAISPDLTDGLQGVENEVETVHTISTLDQSRWNEDILYAGTGDGNVWRTLNGGGNWEMIMSGLPERYVTCIRSSPFDEATVFVSFQGYMSNETTPHLFRSDNYGTTWTSIASDLPSVGINHIQLHPENEDKIYLSTDAGVFFTEDGAEHWSLLGNDLPLVRIKETVIGQDDRLYAGTFARSVWSIDIHEEVVPHVGDEDGVAVSVFPNPSHDVVFIANLHHVRFYDSALKAITVPSAGDRYDVSALPPGSYIVTGLNAKNAMHTEKIIVLR